jgi:hypothetical protein
MQGVQFDAYDSFGYPEMKCLIAFRDCKCTPSVLRTAEINPDGNVIKPIRCATLPTCNSSESGVCSADQDTNSLNCAQVITSNAVALMPSS